MRDNKAYLNKGMQGYTGWSSGTLWAIHVATIAHEAAHHWLATIGAFTVGYHESIAGYVSSYFLPGAWPFVNPWWNH